MTSRLLLHLIVGLTAGPTWLVADAQSQRTRPNTNTIHVSRLNKSKVVGSLGRPLGEVVTIEGIAADESYTRRKADTGDTLLRVQAVNGKSLKREVIFPFHPYEGTQMKRPPAGMRFKYVGYETGGFSGTPEAAFVYVPRAATTGYYFTTSFVILRDDSGSQGRLKSR